LGWICSNAAARVTCRSIRAVSAGLALAARDSAERVEAARDGRQKALLAFDVGGDGTEHRRLFLVGAVGAPQSLDRRIGAPAGLQQIVDPLALIAASAVGVIAAAGAAGIGKDEDALVVVHESDGLGEIRRSRAGLDAEALVAADNAARAAGHFGDKIGAEAVQDLIERAIHRRQRRQMFDQAVAALDGFA
jgi:hypothetical protein